MERPRGKGILADGRFDRDYFRAIIDRSFHVLQPAVFPSIYHYILLELNSTSSTPTGEREPKLFFALFLYSLLADAVTLLSCVYRITYILYNTYTDGCGFREGISVSDRDG